MDKLLSGLTEARRTFPSPFTVAYDLAAGSDSCDLTLALLSALTPADRIFSQVSAHRTHPRLLDD